MRQFNYKMRQLLKCDVYYKVIRCNFKFKNSSLIPQACNFVIDKSCGRQSSASNALERLVKRAAEVPPLSRLFSSFSVMASKHCSALIPF